MWSVECGVCDGVVWCDVLCVCCVWMVFLVVLFTSVGSCISFAYWLGGW